MERTESTSKYLKRLIDLFPSLDLNRLRNMAKSTKRKRVSKYKPHYGRNAAKRNLKHIKEGTHGL